jgi:hypothetical protein
LVSVAVTVIVLAPEARGMLSTVQAEPEPCAEPEDPVLTVHVTAIGPLPPVTEPDSAVDDAAVIAGGAFTTSVIGTYAGDAGAVGEGVVTGAEVCAS